MSFRSPRRSYSTARPSSLYSSSALTKPSSSLTSSSAFLGKGLSQSTPYLSGISGVQLRTGYSGGGSYNKNTLSPALYSSSYRSGSSVRRSVSPSYSSYPTSVARSYTSRPRSRSSSQGYVSGGEKDKDRERDRGRSGGGEEEDEAASTRLGPPHHQAATSTSENGELDYKKLYEESQAENQRLREKLKKTEDDLTRSKLMSDKVPYVPMRNSLSEAEKREKKAMERKLSEMEEELKQLQKLKAENERLKAENRALTRVVSKLTASHNAT